jgi:hypothetical protein
MIPGGDISCIAATPGSSPPVSGRRNLLKKFGKGKKRLLRKNRRMKIFCEIPELT